MVADSGNWLESYSTMGKNMEAEMPEDIEEASTVVVKQTTVVESKTTNHKLKRADVRTLLAVRELIKEYNRRDEEKKQALDIKKVDPTTVGISDSATESYIAKALIAADRGLHINAIIDAIEKMGWVSGSKYHKYSHVRKTISDNYFMFQKVGTATFKLREGFRQRSPVKTDNKQRIIRQKTTKLTTLEDVIISVIKKRQTKFGMYPAGVWYIMKKMGYRCSYSTIHTIMQGPRFKRRGFWYTVKPHDHNKDAKSAKSPK